MGTYDTRGGAPLSPTERDPYIFAEEEDLLILLEDAGVATEVNDKAVAILRRVLEREATGDRVVGSDPADSAEAVRTADADTPRNCAAGSPVVWRCFFCDEVFTREQDAAEHFGADRGSLSGCQIKGYEGGLLGYIRDQEGQLARYRSEVDPITLAMEAMRSEHATALLRVEEVGYGRGVSDTLRMAQPWSVPGLVAKLADAADHLLRDHDCDSHGWEEVGAARDAARTWLADICGTTSTPSELPPQDSPEPGTAAYLRQHVKPSDDPAVGDALAHADLTSELPLCACGHVRSTHRGGENGEHCMAMRPTPRTIRPPILCECTTWRPSVEER